ncbi:hypothetical protein AB0M20_10960 [Actinoplanes sp. NPDC051633]|uniref:hypothetical protein n=1 Tax=Actinoplanes sp. NPDC051633 TaxID=3155670 RepID=UPI0034233383
MAGWPRMVARLGWCVLLAIGVFGIADWAGSSVVVGVLFAVLGAFGLLATLRQRVWVHGNVLYSRRFPDGQPAIRLARRTDAYLTHFARTTGGSCASPMPMARASSWTTNIQVAGLYPIVVERTEHGQSPSMSPRRRGEVGQVPETARHGGPQAHSTTFAAAQG